MASYLPEPLLLEALHLVKALKGPDERDKALVEITLGFVEAGKPQTAELVAQKVKGTGERNKALVEITLGFIEAGKPQTAELVVQKVTNSKERDRLLTIITMRFAEQKKYEAALAVAKEIDHIFTQVKALIKLASFPQFSKRTPVLKEAMEKRL